MPHFIIDCSHNILTQKHPNEIMGVVYDAAEASGLFAEGDIKVRITPFQYYKLGEGKRDFIHISGNIMEGRTTEQKATLSRQIIERFNLMFPEISVLSMNISEFESATYCNKSLINPENINQDRHFNDL
ncbi:5-carboxymethyl-2-hydroxymuconate isomerase [Chryseobacterium piperi]|uniref:5-carboxymethyl-2-hydroxymuconate isomerase n=1 Tax=Chryseobacterium piperi TaxID=558152 RepID=A0A086BLJ3_9FLAO|nr:5-carboxymethyl-2-hydroxymuconate Delta-isomerase [Chryseobacterium piperi]ASW73285.1 5-carboxymethyl-2-hydroxymuconate isomerase [Chryseobacterium piperi]KFF29807.1 5-carboxymethyl-2-hydroxymuconate isomerase [Chryseobacterium piperi]